MQTPLSCFRDHLRIKPCETQNALNICRNCGPSSARCSRARRVVVGSRALRQERLGSQHHHHREAERQAHAHHLNMTIERRSARSEILHHARLACPIVRERHVCRAGGSWNRQRAAGRGCGICEGPRDAGGSGAGERRRVNCDCSCRCQCRCTCGAGGEGGRTFRRARRARGQRQRERERSCDRVV